LGEGRQGDCYEDWRDWEDQFDTERFSFDMVGLFRRDGVFDNLMFMTLHKGTGLGESREGGNM